MKKWKNTERNERGCQAFVKHGPFYFGYCGVSPSTMEHGFGLRLCKEHYKGLRRGMNNVG